MSPQVDPAQPSAVEMPPLVPDVVPVPPSPYPVPPPIDVPPEVGDPDLPGKVEPIRDPLPPTTA